MSDPITPSALNQIFIEARTRNGSMQGVYLIIDAGALGLDEAGLSRRQGRPRTRPKKATTASVDLRVTDAS